MRICVIGQDYPNQLRPAAYVFLQNFAWTAADLGHEVTVICPLNSNRNHNSQIAYHVIETTLKGNKVHVYFPKFSALWFTYRSKIDAVAMHSHYCFTKAIDETIQKEKIYPDVIYAEFLDPAGTAAGKLKEKYHCKAIASFGESSFWTLSKPHINKDIKTLNSLDGIESVSSENKRRLLQKGIQSDDTIVVLPNGIDPERYHKIDRLKAREILGFKKDIFIVSFLGGFIERKGVLRVDQAVSNLKDIYVAYAGRGNQTPVSPNMIFSQSIPPEKVSVFLSASDIFVLPTLNEGCCNAIIEAMACGLPIISSNLPFNDDILNESNSIRIDPNNVQEIRNAILELYNNPSKRRTMGEESSRIAEKLSIENRVRKVISFIEQL